MIRLILEAEGSLDDVVEKMERDILLHTLRGRFFR